MNKKGYFGFHAILIITLSVFFFILMAGLLIFSIFIQDGKINVEVNRVENNLDKVEELEEIKQTNYFQENLRLQEKIEDLRSQRSWWFLIPIWFLGIGYLIYNGIDRYRINKIKELKEKIREKK